MIRFAWRQSRTQTLVAAALLALAAAALSATGPHLVRLYNATVAGCTATGDCQAALQAFQQNDRTMQLALNALGVLVPAVIGLFWGAPLVARELEAGTFRLAWTQTVTRIRWLAVRLILVGLISMAVAGLFSLMVTWWFSPLDRATGSPFSSFDYRDIVPLGYAAFAFALGVALGALTRRTLPAMAIALAAFFAVRLTISFWVRPRLLAPSHQSLALNPATTGYGYQGFMLGSHSNSLLPASPNIPGAWIASTQIVNKAGQPLSAQFLSSNCPWLGGEHVSGPTPGAGSSHSQVSSGTQQTLQGCVATVGKTYHEVVTYQPASHYWPLQWYELAIYLGVAVVLGGFCVWRIRRHPA
jgi:ABC-type transport system involved in multi-copper enzyme maturation permease subunit